ncbi:arginase family protein [Oxalobacteraceae bacterium OTU3CAMAD1]|nr:arginase family protein [Oxalobacteraceae bacterium OTU3CAMAD1]
MSIALTVFQGRAGDHNDLAIPGAKAIGDQLGVMLGLAPLTIGSPETALSVDWRIELDHALPALRQIQQRFEQIFLDGDMPLSATSRCAVSLATLPVVAKYRKDACIVWFDAHADLNTPASTNSGYLGGLALSGPAGLWESGLGAGLALDNLVLVGQRDLDPFEMQLIASGKVCHVPPGPGLDHRLRKAIAGRPIYVHLDCDVLEPGIVPTDYVHAHGLTLQDLRGACEVIAEGGVVGLEIAEFQNSWVAGGPSVSPVPLIRTLEPLIAKLSIAANAA